MEEEWGSSLSAVGKRSWSQGALLCSAGSEDFPSNLRGKLKVFMQACVVFSIFFELEGAAWSEVQRKVACGVCGFDADHLALQLSTGGSSQNQKMQASASHRSLLVSSSPALGLPGFVTELPAPLVKEFSSEM